MVRYPDIVQNPAKAAQRHAESIGADLTVVGKGNSEMEDILKPIAERQGRALVEESNPAGGYYFRSDHFNFAKAGVPALYADGGTDLFEGGTAAGEGMLA